MDLNRATIIGNVTRDPELRTTATGQNVCSFGVATNQNWTDSSGQKQTKAEYHNIVVWGKLAELAGQYLSKGRKVYVEGRLQTREWEAQDGAKRNRTEIVADNFILLDRREGGPATPTGYRTPSPSPASPTASGSSDMMDAGLGEEEIRLEDIPF
ncbi:MAG: single-stranded DNA-binding protein [Candidatus Magasanikbacteria bacterium]|nr:single-stranded DNA-binding protein [Candidatus Magasanikbacteria bacterium]